MIVCCTRRIRRYSPMFARELVLITFAIPFHRQPLWKTTYTCHSYNHSLLLLLLWDASKFSLLFRESLEPTALQFFATWIPLQINPRTCRVSAHPLLFMCYTKVFKILFDLPKILWSLWLLKFLLACIMVNPISLVILLASLVIIILSPLIQYVANSRSPQSDPRILPSGSNVILNMSWYRPIELPSIVPLRLFNLSILNQSVCFWSLDLEIIIPLHLTIELVSCFYNLVSLHYFFLWLSTDAHIRSLVDHQILCWILSDNALLIQ